MLDASLLFSSPPSSIGDVIQTVLEIFGQEWKTLMGLSALYLLSAITLEFTIGIFFAIYFAKDVDALMHMASTLHRHLLDYTSRINGASRLLEKSFSYGQIYYNPADYFDFNPNKLALFPVVLFVLAVITSAFFASVLFGALTHATGEVYAGSSPVLKNSLQQGWLRKWTVLAYQILVSFASFFIVFITFILPVSADIIIQMDAAGGDIDINIDWLEIISNDFGYAFMMIVVFGIFISLLVASIPAIIIENKSAIEAIKRSIILCKGYLCFILCMVFYWSLLQLTAMVIVNTILVQLPTFVSLIGHLLTINFFAVSIAPVLSFVLYMSMRVRDESLDQNQFANKVESSVPIDEAVELNGGE